MVTDPVPAAADWRHEYERSDALVTFPLPPDAILQPPTTALVGATLVGLRPPIAAAARALLGALADFYGISTPSLSVLGVRPHRVTDGLCTYQLFGDYTPATERIRVWMRTAIRAKVASPKALLNVLLHEFCHHLDATHLDCPHSFHTRGFFMRIDRLYHRALATPPEDRRPLRWLRRGKVWTIDWRQLAPRPSGPRRPDDRSGPPKDSE